jgi:hypothetical protein
MNSLIQTCEIILKASTATCADIPLSCMQAAMLTFSRTATENVPIAELRELG